MGASKASISHLLPSSSLRNSNNLNSKVKPIQVKVPISKTPLQPNTNRRLFLFSLPLIPTTFLLFTPPPSPSNSNAHTAQKPGSLNYSALATFEPVSPKEREASATISRRVSEAVELLDKGRELQAQGDFNQALQYFTQVIFRPSPYLLSLFSFLGSLWLLRIQIRKRKQFVYSIFLKRFLFLFFKWDILVVLYN